MPEPATGFTTPCASMAAWGRRRRWDFCFFSVLYLALYHGFFGLLVSLLANPFGKSGSSKAGGSIPASRQVLLLAPFLWVAVELARTRVTGFPWDLLGISQVDNIPLARIATVTGVYGLSFEIMVVNTALAAAFVIRRRAGQRSTADAVAGHGGGGDVVPSGQSDQPSAGA